MVAPIKTDAAKVRRRARGSARKEADARAAAHPFAHLAGTYEGEIWEEVLVAIQENRKRDAEEPLED